MTGVPGVSNVTTDKAKLQASFTYDDAKAKLEEIQNKLNQESNGRYRASVAAPAKKP